MVCLAVDQPNKGNALVVVTERVLRHDRAFISFIVAYYRQLIFPFRALPFFLFFYFF